MVVFDEIEKLKQQFTDKYVVVKDNERSELQRFRGLKGIVRTVNMNGKALVEFDGFENIGWYDIDPDFLQPAPEGMESKAAPSKPAAKPAKAAKPDKSAAQKKPSAASKPDAKAGGMSVDDILAAARGGDAAPAADKPKAEPAAKPKAESTKAKDKPSAAAMSVADVLAAARGDAAPEAETAEPEPTSQPEAATEAPADDVAEAPAPSGDLPTDVEGIVAYCRQCDG